jgi:excisionase family DNA binding protein
VSPSPQITTRRRSVPNTPGVTVTDTLPADLLTVRELAAEFPAVGERFIRRCADERRVGVFKFGTRLLISRAEFVAFLAAGRIEPART